MKHNKAIFLSILYCSVSLVQAITVSSGRRSWELAEDNVSTADIIESKVCALDLTIEQSFFGTATMLAFLGDKTCSILEEVCTILDGLNEASELVSISIDSKIDRVIENVDVINVELNQIHIEDFGGTWTALDELQATLCAKFDNAFSDLDLIESKLDAITDIQESHFIDTFTLLQVVSNNVLLTTIELESLSEQLLFNLSEIDICIMTGKDIMETVGSKICALEVDIETNFDGTFTAIDALLEKACTVESKVDTLLTRDTSTTFSLLIDIEDKLCTISSKLDIIDDEASAVDSVVDNIIVEVETALSKVCIISSISDVINEDAITIESKVDIVLEKVVSIEIDIDELSSIFESATDKACTSLSRLDVIDQFSSTIESSVDVQNTLLESLDSKVDILESIGLLSKVCSLDSRIDVIQDFSSKVDIILIESISIESRVEILSGDAASLLDKLCTIDSKVDAIDDQIVTIQSRVVNVDNSLEIINSNFSSVNTSLVVIESLLVTSNSQIDVIETEVVTLLSKVCTLDSRIDFLDDKVNILSSSVDVTEVKATELNVDMHNTWTILAVIESKICFIEEQELTIDSKLDHVDVTIDLTSIFTLIDSICDKTVSLIDSSITIESQVEAFNESCDLGPTFTVLDELLETICSIDSKVDVLIIDVLNIANSTGVALGVPISVGTFDSTINITEPGRYFLPRDSAFSPSITGTSAIVVDADDVHIDLCERTLKQGNFTEDVSAIVVKNGRCNVSIATGRLLDFTGDVIKYEEDTSFIRLFDLQLSSTHSGESILISSGDLADVGFGCSNIMIRDVSCMGGGIDIDYASGVSIANCMVDMSSTSSAINLGRSNYCCAHDCIVNGGQGPCFALGGRSTLSTNGTSLFVIESCKAMDSSLRGFSIVGPTKNGVIKHCVISSNTTTGSFGEGLYFSSAATSGIAPTKHVCIVNNVISNNEGEGIHIDSGADNNLFSNNQMFENDGVSFVEDTDEGPNSVVRMFAFRSSGANYSSGDTTINTVSLTETGAFPTPEPKYWINVSASP